MSKIEIRCLNCEDYVMVEPNRNLELCDSCFENDVCHCGTRMNWCSCCEMYSCTGCCDYGTCGCS
jgi:hypothetical protein